MTEKKTAKKARNRYMKGMYKYLAALIAGFIAVMACAIYMQSIIFGCIDLFVFGANIYVCKDLFILFHQMNVDIRSGEIGEEEILAVDIQRDEVYGGMAGTSSVRSFFPDGGERFLLKTKDGREFRIVDNEVVKCSKSEPAKGTLRYLKESKLALDFDGKRL